MSISLKSLFKLVYQPDVRLTINDVGVVNHNMSLNDEETAGILFAAKSVFGPAVNDHLRLYLLAGQAIIQYRLADYHEEGYIVYQSSRKLSWRDDTTVERYVRRLAALDGRIPFVPINRNYVLRLKSAQGFTIVQFNSIGFYDRAVQTVQSFGLNPQQYLDHLTSYTESFESLMEDRQTGSDIVSRPSTTVQ